MRRLLMSLLLVPVTAAAVTVAVPSVAMAASSAPAATTRVLEPGMSGAAVKALQRRLAALKYYPGSIDGHFGADTQEAVWAFQETQGLPGRDYVSAAMERALANPRAPKILDRAAGANRIEVNLGDEVLVLYRNNQIQLISHVSSGGGYYFCSPGGGCGYAITPTGNFRTIVFMAGWVQVPLGEMYNPTFFIGTAYAIHGDTEVPLAPVSHGCVRIPMDIAAFFHTLVRIPGEPVIIRG
jgi:peptidoglycan hydrolase-like protein with peptidoglycan-binding domain